MKTQNKISAFLVDDNGMFLKVLELSLQEYFKSDIEVESFFTGEDCLKAIHQNPETLPDIVLLDYHLNTESKNAMNGIEVLRKIKENNPEIIVIMLSAENEAKIANESINFGAYEYVGKSETAFIRVQKSLKNSIEKEFNSKILKITMTILEKYPELYSYIEEMPITIPNENKPEIGLKNLIAYYDSLDSILNNYKLKHPDKVTNN